MGKPGNKPKAKAVGEAPEDIEPDLVKQHFDQFLEGNYEALVPLGFACLERGWPTTAYAAWYLAVLKEVPDVVPLVVVLANTMSAGEQMAAEEDVKQLLPKIALCHCH